MAKNNPGIFKERSILRVKEQPKSLSTRKTIILRKTIIFIYDSNQIIKIHIYLNSKISSARSP